MGATLLYGVRRLGAALGFLNHRGRRDQGTSRFFIHRLTQIFTDSVFELRHFFGICHFRTSVSSACRAGALREGGWLPLPCPSSCLFVSIGWFSCKNFLEPRRSDQVEATSMCDVRSSGTRNALFPEIPKNQERTTVKKQIDRCIKAHLLRSALILLSLVTFNEDIFCQSPTPTATASPSPTATECPRATPGTCVSYEAESDTNTLTGSAFVQSCPTCSGGTDVGYVGNNCW